LLAQKQFQSVHEKALGSDRVVARMGAMVLQQYEEATIEILQSYAARILLVDSVKNKDEAGVRIHLADLKQKHQEIDLAFVTDANGLLWANYPVLPGAIGRDLSFRNWYKGVSATWTPYVSTVFQLIVGDQPLGVAVAVPIHDFDGAVIGILANTQRLVAIDQLFQSLQLDLDGTLCLIDQAGNIIYNSRGNVDFITTYPLYADISKAVQEGKTKLEIIDREGQGKKFLAVAPTDMGWTVVVERSWHDTLHSEYSRLVRTGVIALLLFLLIAAFILYQNSLHQKTLTLLQLERQLRQSEKRYKDLIDNIPDILYSFSDGQADNNYYSPQVGSVLGYTAGHLRAHPTLWHDSIHPNHLPEVNQAIQAALSGQKVELEYRIYDVLGQCHWLTDHMTSTTNDRGETIITGIASDITDRKNAEAALQKSREKYQALVGNMLDGFAYCQMLYDDRGCPIDFLHLEVNDAFARLTGLQDVTGKKFSEVFPGTYEGRENLLERYSRVALTGNAEKFEYFLTPLALWFDLSVASHEEGCILVVFSNITTRKLLAQQRQAALSLLQNVTDRVPGVVFQCRMDVDGRFSFPFVSKGLDEIYRLNPVLVQENAAKFFDVHHPEDQDGIVASLYASAKDVTPWVHEYRLKFDDGTERWMSGSAVPQRAEDGSTLWHGVITDITEHKQVEDALRESEARFSTAARVANFGVYSYDFASGQSYYSPDLLMLFGLPPNSKIELDQDMIATALHPDDKPAFLERIIAALDPCGPATLEYEYRIIRIDGEVRWLRVIGKTVFTGNTPSDRPLHANGIVQDITERKQAEEQLRLINDELERRVERRTRELQETQSQFLHAEKLSAIGKLSASIAHEFNSPLQAVMTVLKGLKLGVTFAAEDRQLLDAAIGESERMKNLIRSLQDFNRPSSGRKIPMDVHTSLDSLLLLCRSDFSRKRISTVLNYAGRLPQIIAIPDQIKQVFLNLLNNAADACADEGGVITISTWQKENRVAVAIQDTGSGIPPEKIDLIFQPFYTTKPAIKGTGLGLSVCHGIVQNHHGEILVESQPGVGSTFTVLLPINEV